jgi:hypothetical protein
LGIVFEMNGAGANADASPCDACGAPLAEVLYVRTIRCTYCSKEQTNPRPLRPNDEVIVDGGIAYSLLRVSACEGPDAVTLTSNDLMSAVAGGTKRLEDVIPVGPLPADAPLGTSVFAKTLIGWKRTRLGSSARGGSVKVKHDSDGFQDTFFDDEVPTASVRVPLCTQHDAPLSRAARTLFVLRQRRLLTPLVVLVLLTIVVVAVKLR